MDKITHEARLNNWKHIVEECKLRFYHIHSGML